MKGDELCQVTRPEKMNSFIYDVIRLVSFDLNPM